MSYEFLYEDRVDNDIDEALDYYFSINPNLAEDFLDRIEEAKTKILNSVEGFEIKYADSVRTVLLKQFPYHLYYTIDQNNIVVLAILHAHSGQNKINEI
ncbi:type II toxin-antitoxin system RelE/ParE family toxin [Epilithonimonas hominis]|uniref:Type II toxin-antitoxin system RelE/ParE family toxin n=1 Tax=Epilithonimonas hominis TaxID=420404 RepID=A0A3N0X1I6_9FLAO|nr:type II toxin-antitoxin system RelE/ParE family toxin [Epilithonimonas hominis]ROI11153.1 type II toxin-antitoxin system RelE/ParE family toxin [Epilithonimonas hominis]